ncbi:uncharacterized protein LOC116169806 [Photinus pyralis]|nr:uncharacterized protein LOC116169806 [Photinus pyralis]
MAKYPLISNCPLLEPPKVNREVKNSVSEATLARDSRLMAMQSRICSALSALGSAINILLIEDEDTSRLLVEKCSDAARLIADLHHEQSQARRMILKGALNKDLAATLTEVSVDGWLFGDNLSDRIKAAKALDKTTVELRARSASNPVAPRAVPSLNFRGPPRFAMKQQARQGGPRTQVQSLRSQIKKSLTTRSAPSFRPQRFPPASREERFHRPSRRH